MVDEATSQAKQISALGVAVSDMAQSCWLLFFQPHASVTHQIHRPPHGVRHGARPVILRRDFPHLPEEALESGSCKHPYNQ